MSLTDLLKTAQQRQQELQAIEDQKAEAKEQEHQKELAIEKEEFETQLKMYAGDILDRLDDKPQVEPRLHGCTVLRVNVFHRTLLLRILDKPIHSAPTGSWEVRDRLRSEYRNISEYRNVSNVNFSDKEECVSGCNLSDYLLLRILQISEEHDHLLVQIEIMNFEKAKQERLRLFSEALYAAYKLHDKKIQAQIEAVTADQWTWPKDFVLDLYKVSWCTGAYRNDEDEDAVFDYDSGWSLSDIIISEPEYFVMLPERYGTARTVKTSSPLTVERFRFTESTLPDRLFDLPKKLEIELVSIEFELDFYNHRYKLLPEFIPQSPEGCKVSVENCTGTFDLKRLPCIEIRLAIDEAVATVVPNNVPLDDIHF